MIKKFFALSSFVFLLACGDQHLQLNRFQKANNGGSTMEGVEAAVTFERDIKPLFERACQACHNNGSAIPDWSNYEVSFAKRDRLLERVVIKRDMPLGIPITEEERRLIGDWLRLGAPKGGSRPTTPVEPVEPALENEVLTYAQVKSKVFDPYCAVCHNENSGELMPNWGNPETVRGLKDKIYSRVVLDKTMPPPGLPFSEEAREILKKWIDDGAVE